MAYQPNPFVNPHERGFLLPPGCKDLNDVLKAVSDDRKVTKPRIEVGYARDLKTHVSRLYEATSQRRLLIVANTDRELSLLIWHGEGRYKLSILIPPVNISLEKAITELFEQGSVSIKEQSGAELRQAVIRLPDFFDDAAQCISDLVDLGCRMQEDERLYFVYVELAGGKSEIVGP